MGSCWGKMLSCCPCRCDSNSDTTSSFEIGDIANSPGARQGAHARIRNRRESTEEAYEMVDIPQQRSASDCHSRHSPPRKGSAGSIPTARTSAAMASSPGPSSWNVVTYPMYESKMKRSEAQQQRKFLGRSKNLSIYTGRDSSFDTDPQYRSSSYQRRCIDLKKKQTEQLRSQEADRVTRE